MPVAASGGSAEDHDQSSGAAATGDRPQHIAQTVPSGAATNTSTMSGIRTAMAWRAASPASPSGGGGEGDAPAPADPRRRAAEDQLGSRRRNDRCARVLGPDLL